MNRWSWSATLLAICVAGCGSPERAEEAENGVTMPAGNETPPLLEGNQADGRRAIADLQTTLGEAAGTATATATGDGIMLSIAVEGLPPGQHGTHVHMAGRCDPPSFESAGSHWNPTDTQHGLENPQGPHAGDMPNLVVGDNGRGTLEYTLQGGTFEGLLDSDGSTLVIHASADDQRTDPAGASGDRIACGVFRGT